MGNSPPWRLPEHKLHFALGPGAKLTRDRQKRPEQPSLNHPPVRNRVHACAQTAQKSAPAMPAARLPSIALNSQARMRRLPENDRNLLAYINLSDGPCPPSDRKLLVLQISVKPRA